MDLSTFIFAKEYFEQHIYHWYFISAIIGMCLASCVGLVVARLPALMNYQSHKEAKELLEDNGFNMENEVFDSVRNIKKPDGLWYPASRCDHCHTPLKLWHNIPLLGWLMLRGKCAYCKTKIPVSVLGAEILGGILGATIAYMTGVNPWLFMWLGITACFAASCWVDWNTGYLPTDGLLKLMWFGILLSMLNFNDSLLPDLKHSIMGAVIGYLILYFIDRIVLLIKGCHGYGGGDLILFAALGAFVGPNWIIIGFFMAQFVGCILMIPNYFKNKKEREICIKNKSQLEFNFENEEMEKENTIIHFGPALALGVFLSILLFGVLNISNAIPINFL